LQFLLGDAKARGGFFQRQMEAGPKLVRESAHQYGKRTVRSVCDGHGVAQA